MKKAGIFIATFLLIASMMTACGCNGSVTTDPSGSTTTQSTTKSTAPSTTSTAATTAPSTAPSTTKGPENPTNSTENNTSTPGMRRRPMPMG